MGTDLDQKFGPLHARDEDSQAIRVSRFLPATALDELPRPPYIVNGNCDLVRLEKVPD